MLKYLLYRIKYMYSPWLELVYPVDVTLELSSHCNMKCSYCYHSQKEVPFQKGFMSLQTASKILKEAHENKVSSIKFVWKGEQTLNPNFYQIAKIAKDYNFMERIINSNFKFGHEKNDIFNGLCCMTKVKVSFDSFIEEVFEQRDKGSHALILSNIDKFYAIKPKGTELVIQAVRTKRNEHEDIEGAVKKRWPGSSVSIRDVVSGRKEENITDLEIKEKPIGRIPCRQAFARLIFNHKGQAFPCCPDIKEKLVLGDINFQTIEEIWNGPLAQSLRLSLSHGVAFKKEPCQSCSSFESYKGYKPNFKA